MYENTQKRNNIKGSSIICSYIWHVNISKYAYWLDTYFVYVWWRYKHECSSILYENTQKKRNKIKRRSITCCQIWHIDKSTCVFWLVTHSVKVWWSYVLPNTNDAHFCDITFRHKVVLPTYSKNLLKIKKPTFDFFLYEGLPDTTEYTYFVYFLVTHKFLLKL